MNLSDCLVAFTLGLRPQTFPSRTDAGTTPAASRLSRLPLMELLRVQRVSDSVGQYVTRFPLRTILSSPLMHKVDTPKEMISELYTSPAYPRANASPPPYGKPTHNSGP